MNVRLFHDGSGRAERFGFLSMSFLWSSFIGERLGAGRDSYPGYYLEQKNRALPAQRQRW